MIDQFLKEKFPRLKDAIFKVSSQETLDYNCIAWAAGDAEAWWWPDRNHQYYWPSGIPRNDSPEAFIKLFGDLGYQVCGDPGLEPEFEKLAIFVNRNDSVTHAARQLKSGLWTSKLGANVDIEHTLDGITGECYGRVAVIMKRRIEL